LEHQVRVVPDDVEGIELKAADAPDVVENARLAFEPVRRPEALMRQDETACFLVA
jgi:hypothetical protein